uniref:DMT family transporter n=1 Tax=Mesorhizobium sp. WSM4875 TaxID=3038539 RepID=UPI0024171148|nr:DMT family transporter [Mesorhizobium sp. WSM4875]WIE94722.1 DMT family transporter [Mesorhizobium sp. WSM4875]
MSTPSSLVMDNPSAIRSKALALAAMLLAASSMAIAFPLVTLALQVTDPLPLSAIRFVSAAALALIWIVWMRAPFPSWPHVVRYLGCGLTGSACYSVFINMGQVTVSAGAASFITNIIPILTALIAWPMLGERLNWAGWVGCIIGFAGTSFIAMGQPGGLSFGAGAMFIFLASLAASIYFVLQKPLVEAYGAMPCTAYTLVFSALFLLPWFPQSIAQVSQADTPTLLAIFGLFFFPTLLACIGSAYALERLPAGVAASFYYPVAPLATFFAFIFLGDMPSIPTLLGGALAILGTIMVARWGRAESAKL